MVIDFLEIDSNQMVDVLPFVSEGLADFKKERQTDWQPEHVYGSLFLGLTQLTIIMNEDNPIGFVVSRWMVEPHTNQPYLHIWLMHLVKEARGHLKETIKPIIDYFWGKCQQRGGVFMEVPTTREGWEKALQPEMKLEVLIFRKRA